MIKVNQVGYKYSRKKALFSNLSFEVGAGRITGLLGLNGEGKTSLLKILSGQLLYKQGEINIMGDDPRRRSVSFLSNVFYLPEVLHLPKGISVKTFFNTMKGFYPTFSQEVADEVLSDFEIEYDMIMSHLSQGQQKKLMLAFGISLGVPVLLLDEPTNGLDIPSKSVFRRLLAKHIREDQTVIISTHQVRDLEQIIDYVMVLQDNQILLNMSLADLTDYYIVRHVNEGDSPLYEEASPGGTIGLCDRDEGDDYSFSTEIFFNALLKNKDEVFRKLQRKGVGSFITNS